MKFIVVAGGVLSGLGKGVVCSSVGMLLKSKGYNVTAVKIDPYVSVDAGTMRPAEHGEVFVTHDGGEIDQDLGNYERFMNITVSKDNNLTTGKIFQRVIHKERHFHYKGRDVELVPDVINEIKDMIYTSSKGYDFSIVEVGGTTGDLENMPFLHAAREIGKESPTVYIMVTYLPYVRSVGELKTKPTQHAVARLREIGIMPDFIVTRNEIPIDEPRKENIAKRCFVAAENIIDDPDIDSIYKIPFLFEKNKFADKILKSFNLKNRKSDLKLWKKFVNNLENPTSTVRVALIGKYVTHGSSKHKDVYISVLEAIKHASSRFKINVEIEAIDACAVEKMSEEEMKSLLGGFDGILVPQGWGKRGSEGKIRAAKYARENNIPFLGLCFGMQMATVEFGRNVLGLERANSEESDPKTKHPVIHIMPEQREYLKKMQYGGTIRLGAWPCVVKRGTKLYGAYKKYGAKDDSPWFQERVGLKGSKYSEAQKGKDTVVWERHRHRYEFNNKYREQFAKEGFVISGSSPDGKLVEAIELAEHPFFVGTQFHPEYLSRPLSPHPIFTGFVETLINEKRSS
jgi:CTP synthase